MDNLWIIYGYGWWLSPIPLKNISLSIGMMTFPIHGTINNVPNHQPAMCELSPANHAEWWISVKNL